MSDARGLLRWCKVGSILGRRICRICSSYGCLEVSNYAHQYTAKSMPHPQSLDHITIIRLQNKIHCLNLKTTKSNKATSTTKQTLAPIGPSARCCLCDVRRRTHLPSLPSLRATSQWQASGDVFTLRRGWGQYQTPWDGDWVGRGGMGEGERRCVWVCGCRYAVSMATKLEART